MSIFVASSETRSPIQMAVTARAATAAAAAAGVMPPSLLAASYHAAAFTAANSVENLKGIPSVVENNPLVNPNIMFMPPYINPFMQVSFILKGKYVDYFTGANF